MELYLMPIRYEDLGGIVVEGEDNSSVQYRFSKDYELTLKPNERTLVVRRSEQPVKREVTVICPEHLELFWDDNQLNYKLPPNFIYIDGNDGGLALYAQSNTECKVQVIIRQVTVEIDVIEDDELSIPVLVRLKLPTGSLYESVASNSWDESVDAYQYEQNLYKLKNSDSGVSGYKAFDLVSFFPGKNISFTVQVDSETASEYEDKIILQAIDDWNVGEVLMDIASDMINPESIETPLNLVGRITKGSWVGECDVTGGTITGKFDYSKHKCRFVSFTNGQGDTAIIKSYIPNSDPLQGGTFVLTGRF